MRVITMLRVVVALSALVLAGACNDAFSTPPNVPSTDGLAVIPRSATIQAGQVVALQARLIDENGDQITGLVSWTSSNQAVATVAASGEVLGRGAGHATIAASLQGKSQTATILVLAKPSKPDGGKRQD